MMNKIMMNNVAYSSFKKHSTLKIFIIKKYSSFIIIDIHHSKNIHHSSLVYSSLKNIHHYKNALLTLNQLVIDDKQHFCPKIHHKNRSPTQ